jgi:CRISPR-associated protein Cmr6
MELGTVAGFRSESVAAFRRNGWPTCVGISGRIGSEYAHWKALLQSAFEHAFQWLGFGAKTAVGYGAMDHRDRADTGSTGESQATATGASANPTAVLAPQAPRTTSKEEIWHSASIAHNKGGGGIVTAQAVEGRAEARGPAAKEFLSLLSEEQRGRLKKGQLVGVSVVVKVEGNKRTLMRLS